MNIPERNPRRSRASRLLGVMVMLAAIASISAVVLVLAAETGIFGSRPPRLPEMDEERRFALARHVETEGGGDWVRVVPGNTPARAVVLIHGLDEPGTIWDDVAPALHDAGFVTLRFDYPNDQAIADSATLLRQALHLLAAQGCAQIDLVCHSMGGLVARDALTREAASPKPRVRRLILVGTPNHGSPLAPLRAVAEAREQIVRWARSLSDPPPLDAYLSDGEGEAGVDLAPGSPFLTELNARPTPPGVSVTIIAGRLAPLTDEDARSIAESPMLRWFGGAESGNAIGDAVNLLGDGVVPLDSAMLQGVSDVVVVNANHRAMLKRSALENTLRDAADAPGAPPPAIPIILDRLLRDDQE